MKSRWRSILVAAVAVCMLSIAGVAAAQYTVVTVLPNNTVVLRGPDGVRSYEVPAGTTFDADGKPGVAMADLKPGMKVSGKESGIASWKSEKVMVHQELNAQVVAAAGNSLLIRAGNGTTEKYEWSNASDIAVVKDGKVVDASSIHVGDRITGMIVQKAGPGSTAKASTEPAVAEKAPAKPAAPAPAAAPPAKPVEPAPKAQAAPPAPAAAPAAEPAPAHKKLPKTASPLPLLELAGALSMAAGAGLRIVRRSRPSA